VNTVEVSFVLPCLNEAETLQGCLRAALRCIEENRLTAEVIVADNGSSDGSQELARRCGARVVEVKEKGYGSALRGGIDAARGRFIVMADSDQSYDLGAAMPFIEKLRAGVELVMGTRFGQGRIMPGAMPLKHRYFGNPVLSWIGRAFFSCPVRDFHCGLRAFRKDAYALWDLRSTGMEFATEMVIKATLRGARIAEVPVTLYKDARNRPPHLRSWRDGWRHLRFMFCLSPRWTLLLPGAAVFVAGAVLGLLVGFGPLRIGTVTLDLHALVAASLMMIVGYQWVTAAVAMRIFALTSEIGPPSPTHARLFRVFTLERALIAGNLMLVAGLATIGRIVVHWAASGFGALDVNATMRPMIMGATLAALGVQTVLMSFVYSMMGRLRDGRP
jgi:glycosyltransferase involved in cell wall biosynthesis